MRNGLVLLFVLLLGPSPAGQAEPGRQHWRSRQALEPIVMISKYLPNGDVVAHGTGIVVDIADSLPNVFLVTNKHLIGSHDSLRISARTYRHPDTTQWLVHSVAHGVMHLRGALIPSTDDSDFVAIPVPRTLVQMPNGITSDRIVDFDSLIYGERVEFWGYPVAGLTDANSFFPMVRSGHLASFVNEDIDFAGKKLVRGMIVIDGLSDGGNSGGPIYARRVHLGSNIMAGPRTPHIEPSYHLVGIIGGHFSNHKLRMSVVGEKDTVQVLDEVPMNLAYGYSITTIIDFIRTRLSQSKESAK